MEEPREHVFVTSQMVYRKKEGYMEGQLFY
jgi:hypothetical protein